MKKFFIFFLIFSIFLIGLNQARAQSSSANNPARTDSASSPTLRNPLGSIDSPQQLIGKIINNVLGVVGSLALLMFIYGGLTTMTSAGNAEKLKKGNEILLWTAMGLLTVFGAYAMVRFVIGAIAQ